MIYCIHYNIYEQVSKLHVHTSDNDDVLTLFLSEQTNRDKSTETLTVDEIRVSSVQSMFQSVYSHSQLHD